LQRLVLGQQGHRDEDAENDLLQAADQSGAAPEARRAVAPAIEAAAILGLRRGGWHGF